MSDIRLPILDNSITDSKIADGAVTPQKLSQPLTSLASLPTTSGTSVGYQSIPSWVKSISLQLEGVSISANDNIYIQIGDSGGLETSGYVGVSGSTSFTLAFGISSGSAANTFSGVLQLENKGNNTWNAFGSFANPVGGTVTNTAGYKTLSDTLTQIFVVAPSGVFDAGSVNINYE